MNVPIFIVEDDADDFDFMKQAFRESGADNVIGFPNGFDLIRHLESLDDAMLPRLVITDYNLPKIDGFNLASYLKRNERFKNINLVVLTGSIHDNDKHRLLSAGVCKIYTKPSSFSSYKNIAEELKAIAEGNTSK
jgi:CheY-like chemotaxis protein